MTTVETRSATARGRDALKAEALARPLRAAGGGLVLGVAAVAAIYPLVWLLLTALKTRSDFISHPFALPTEWRFQNLVDVLSNGELLHTLVNSLVVTSVATVSVVALGVPAGYALARLSIRGGKFLLGTFLLSEMIPASIVAIPILLTYQWIGVGDDRLRLVLAYVVSSMGFVVFVTRQFFLTVPDQLREAAWLDGCSELQTFLRVMLPIARPSVALVAVFAGVFAWNEYYLALVLINDASSLTLPLGLAQFQGQHTTDWPRLAAAVVLSAIPTLVLFAVFQGRITKGLSRGAALK